MDATGYPEAASGQQPKAILMLDGGQRYEVVLTPERRHAVVRSVSPSGREAWRRNLPAEIENAVMLAHAGGRLYAALYVTAATGCRVVALDGATGDLLWERRPDGLGTVLHSKYRNRVTLSATEAAVLVSGHESAGSYRERLDPASGQTLSTEVVEP
jgi:outer membrane protein assembly factor BamB